MPVPLHKVESRTLKATTLMNFGSTGYLLCDREGIQIARRKYVSD
jgi:hypothetical protein